MKFGKTEKILAIACIIVSLMIGCGYVIDNKSTTTSPETSNNASSTIEETPTNTYELQLIDGNYYVNGDEYLIVANKSHKLADGYEPSDLVEAGECSTGACYMRKEAASAYQSMKEDALNEGITLYFTSAYRSESYQNTLYNNYVANSSIEAADTFSSRPGYSDHQTGLALDFISLTDRNSDFDEEKFFHTVEGQWLYNNAYKYGFILRYPEGKEKITGYQYESWHYRYVGIDNALLVHNAGSNMSLEEVFNFSGGDYVE